MTANQKHFLIFPANGTSAIEVWASRVQVNEAGALLFYCDDAHGNESLKKAYAPKSWMHAERVESPSA